MSLRPRRRKRKRKRKKQATDESIKEIQLEEEYRMNNIFLSACNNFNSDIENVNLLFYGYIHFMFEDDTCLYENIPIDIIAACIAFAYDIDTMQKNSDVFDIDRPTCCYASPSYKKTKNKNYNNTIFKYEMSNVSNDGFRVYGLWTLRWYMVDNGQCIRRLWKVKLLKYDKMWPIQFRMGLYDHSYNQDSSWSLTMSFNQNVKIGDIVSMLLLFDIDKVNNINDDWSDVGIISFAINGKVIGNNIELTYDECRYGRYSFVITSDHNISMQIVQD